jgi:hypothetical protein
MTPPITSRPYTIRRFVAAMSGLCIVLSVVGAVTLVFVEAPQMLEDYTAHE